MRQRRRRAMVTAVAAVGGMVVAVPAVSAAPVTSSAAGTGPVSTVVGSAPTGGATALGPVPASRQLTLQIWLAGDEAAATQFDDAVSRPGSTTYRDYLTPAQYTAQFGPSVAEAAQVQAWLTSAGMSDVTLSSQRDYVSATASVATVNSAFGVQMTRYRVPTPTGGETTIAANNQALSVPSALSPDILSVTGLSGDPDAPSQGPAPRDPALSGAPASAGAADAGEPKCSSYWGQYTQPLPAPFRGMTTAARAVCGYSATQIRAAYGMDDTNTGTGETVAIIGEGVPDEMFQTLVDYADSNGLPAPQPTQLTQEQIGAGPACGNYVSGEEQAESEAVYAMAPGASQLLVEPDSCDRSELDPYFQKVFDAESAVLAGNGTAPQASIMDAVAMDDEFATMVYEETAHAIALRAVAEGVGMYVPASSYSDPGVSVPSSDPYVTAVGGTTLGIGSDDQVLFQTGCASLEPAHTLAGWVIDNLAPTFATGGGRSLLWAQPSYQAGVVPASMSTQFGRTDRTTPDIAADADVSTSVRVGIIEPTADGQPGPYRQDPYDGAGAPEATALVAGMVADAQQGQASPFGFANPLLYSLAGSTAFDDTLPLSPSLPQTDRMANLRGGGLDDNAWEVFDSDVRFSQQVTAPGYDTTTGLGTPNGQAFIDALRSGQ